MVDTILHCACTREQFILTLIIYCFFVEKYLLFLRRKDVKKSMGNILQ